SAACTREVSESPTFTPLVHDVNPVLFPGTNSDGGGASSRTVVIGKRQTALAVDGNRYSLALQGATQHYYRITCSGIVYSGSFETKNMPLGHTYAEALPADSNRPGEYNYPTVFASDRSQVIIDPVTGAAIRRVGIPGDGDKPNDGSDGGSFEM